MTGRICDVRFAPKSGHSAARCGCPLSAKSRHLGRAWILFVVCRRVLRFVEHDGGTPPSKIPASGGQYGRAPGRIAFRLGSVLSVTASAHHRRLSCRRHCRYRRASGRTMSLGKIKSAVRYREPSGRRHQYCDRDSRPCATRWLYTARRCFDQYN